MKLPVAFLGLALVTSAMQAQTLPAPAPTAKPAAAKPAAPTTSTAPAVKADPKAKTDPKAKVDDKKKKDEMGVIKGTTIARADGTFLGLEVVSGNWVLSFYDKKKKPTGMGVVTRGTARWPNVRGPGDNRTVLNGSGTKLVGSKTVLPPYTFNVYITLLKGEGDDATAVESFVAQYRG